MFKNTYWIGKRRVSLDNILKEIFETQTIYQHN
jgi:hypothetical protein